jgi:hypothetical protein
LLSFLRRLKIQKSIPWEAFVGLATGSHRARGQQRVGWSYLKHDGPIPVTDDWPFQRLIGVLSLKKKLQAPTDLHFLHFLTLPDRSRAVPKIGDREALV